MESAIGVGIEAVKTLVVLIQDVQDAPDLVADIKDTAHQFRGILDGSSDLRKIRYLNAKQMDDMISSQKICIEQLHAITAILRSYFNTKKSSFSVTASLKFVLFQKGDLESHMEKLIRHTELLEQLIEQLRANAPSREISFSIAQGQRPVQNIEQYAFTKMTAPETASDK
ncbi:hypothetical protein ONS95_003270 [Cadophora gregata]|uniref:uncharacterized protein n=1 Tax=Cadophora gregata TaxID=51156 RepID=UPI0026DD583F|nr:uncharacterized protein ONS95_003270 [Cadophora gregata]KAK0108467.1 hypothetical protein ONS95_003270 [Cadophora gregata]KAK0108942.1 hypothetical protein ONS96_002779 [Cadophora gregata f. sp. sojae]